MESTQDNQQLQTDLKGQTYELLLDVYITNDIKLNQ